MNNTTTKQIAKITTLQFNLLCGEYLIDPQIALECPDIRQAIKDKDLKKIKQLLETNF